MPGYGPGQIAEELLRCASKLGFTTAATGSGTFRLAKTERPKWATIAAIGTAPFLGLGLLFLLVKRPVDGVATVFEDREGTKVRLVGAAGGRVAEMLDTMNGSRTTATAQPAADPFKPISAPMVPSPSAPPTAMPTLIATTPFNSAPPAAPAPAPPSPSTFGPPGRGPYAPPAVPSPPRSLQNFPPLIGLPSLGFSGAAEPTVDLDRTMARSALGSVRSASSGELLFPDGRKVEIGAGVVVGRSPVQDPALPSATLLPLGDPSLSKTHATIGIDTTGVWLIDHHSTNGTSVSFEGRLVPCAPGVRTAVPAGAQLMLGELEVRLGGNK